MYLKIQRKIRPSECTQMYKSESNDDDIEGKGKSVLHVIPDYKITNSPTFNFTKLADLFNTLTDYFQIVK